VHEWLQDAVDRLAAESGAERAELELTQAEIDDLLELARIAAHESGERVNAPLVCYLVGLARGRQGAELGDLIDAAVGKRAG
jgi:hypothetical protein